MLLVMTSVHCSGSRASIPDPEETYGSLRTIVKGCYD